LNIDITKNQKKLQPLSQDGAEHCFGIEQEKKDYINKYGIKWGKKRIFAI